MKKEVFIEKAIAVHGDKYDYSLLPDEFSTKDKIPVICRDHGVFIQKASNHTCLKQLCPVCGDNKALESKRIKGYRNFLQKASNKFGSTFDYSRVVYIRENLPVTIFCPVHGTFEQTPADHLKSKYGCAKCSSLAKSKYFSDSLDDFVIKAINVHGCQYNYSKVNYTNAHKKVEIICDIHGSFHQTPNSHLSGSGCSKCGDMRGGRWSLRALDKNLDYFKNTKCFLYLMEIVSPQFSCFKVGISEMPDFRRNAICKEITDSVVSIVALTCSNVYDCLSQELDIKSKLAVERFIVPLKFAGHTECYKHSEDVKIKILEWFK